MSCPCDSQTMEMSVESVCAFVHACTCQFTIYFTSMFWCGRDGERLWQTWRNVKYTNQCWNEKPSTDLPLLLTLLYKSFESILCSCVVCWYGNSKISNRNKLGNIFYTCGKIMGMQQSDLYHIPDKQVFCICLDTSHPLSVELKTLLSGCRYRYPKIRTRRIKKSLISMAIAQLNKLQSGDMQDNNPF